MDRAHVLRFKIPEQLVCVLKEFVQTVLTAPLACINLPKSM